MLFSLEAARANVRNKDGRRVFYLGKGDQLTSDARDFLNRERIEILPSSQARPERYKLLCGGYMEEKPEHMTHLNGEVLVPKTHPRIAFRGAMDTLEAELLLCMLAVPSFRKELAEILNLARNILRWDVLGEPAREQKLCGLTQQELRSHSHRPQDYYGQPHFMPEVSDGETVLRLNRVRALTRAAELKAAAAFTDSRGYVEREDLLRCLNRMSSMVYLLMIRAKANQ